MSNNSWVDGLPDEELREWVKETLKEMVFCIPRSKGGHFGFARSGNNFEHLFNDQKDLDECKGLLNAANIKCSTTGMTIQISSSEAQKGTTSRKLRLFPGKSL